MHSFVLVSQFFSAEQQQTANTMASSNKLIDYTQRGKPFNQQYESHLTTCCGSSLTSCASEPNRHNNRSHEGELNQESDISRNNSDTSTLEATLGLLMTTVDTQHQSTDDTRIDFMLKIPSRRGREQRSDLRERFSKSRPISYNKRYTTSHIIETVLGDSHLSKRRTRKQQRASF